MLLIQTHIEVLLVQMERNTPKIFRKPLNMGLQGESLVSYQKPYRYADINTLKYYHVQK
jgi:hypothetical protein